MSLLAHTSFWKHYRLTQVTVWTSLILIYSATALAHNVTVFAWVQGDTVYTESKFSGGRKVKEAPIEVFDTTGAMLLAGKTDKDGKFSFKLPKKEELKIILRAGMGHGNQWILTAEDIAEAQTESNESASVNAAPKMSQRAPRLPASVTDSNRQTTAQEIELSMENALDKKLAPILKKLNRLEATQKTETGFTEIIGGIGYILGLLGLAAFIRYHRKTNGRAQ